uniref:Uncharacterized protein n=1 Tax=Nelumbo nucifera TaxID=4432 RepID=A0A822ZE76_NELNU|nr:TPA_asm: hypothetical protein HUJ06_000261 [Nelumbo nucifera]
MDVTIRSRVGGKGEQRDSLDPSCLFYGVVGVEFDTIVDQ